MIFGVVVLASNCFLDFSGIFFFKRTFESCECSLTQYLKSVKIHINFVDDVEQSPTFKKVGRIFFLFLFYFFYELFSHFYPLMLFIPHLTNFHLRNNTLVKVILFHQMYFFIFLCGNPNMFTHVKNIKIIFRVQTLFCV